MRAIGGLLLSASGKQPIKTSGKEVDMKAVKVSNETHDQLLSRCKKSGTKIQHAAEVAIKSWLKKHGQQTENK